MLAALLFFVYFLINAYKLPNTTSSLYQFPNSIATNMVMIPVTLIVAVYFISELLYMSYAKDIGNMIAKIAPAQQLMMMMNGKAVPLVQPESVKLLQVWGKKLCIC